MRKKLKIFLGAYVNYPNAQNVNCDNIAKYLDKRKFEVHTMYTSRMPIDKGQYKNRGIKIHKLIHHRFIWYWCRYLQMLLGRYDIYYLPKIEPVDIAFIKRYKKSDKLFVGSVEGVITDSICGEKSYKEYYTDLLDAFFAISPCIASSVEKAWGMEHVSVIPLGVNPLEMEETHHEYLRKIIWVGNFDENKRPELLVECASYFPQLEFTMVGDGNLLDAIQQSCQERNLQNVKFTGRIQNERVYEQMKKHDLLLMTSWHEGLPKVVQEAAQCGLPSIYFNEVYSIDFIESGINGYAVGTVENMIQKIQFLIEKPLEYKIMSQRAYQIIQNYRWDNLVKNYEEFFVREFKRKIERNKSK